MHLETNGRWKDYPVQSEPSNGALDPNSSLGQLVDAIGERKRVLDVGCATGYLARFLQRRQCDTVGIDINPKAAEEARRYCSQVVVTDLDSAPITAGLEDDAFDVIVFADVLEHLRNPLTVLDDARALLREGGYVLVSLPNIAHGSVRLALLNGRFDYQNLGLLDDTHVRFFTRKTAEEMFVEAGYRLEVLGRTIVPLFEANDLVPNVFAADYSSEAIEAVRRDPDFETLQFIFKAYPLSNEARFRTLAKHFLSANTELTTARARVERQTENVERLSAQLGELTAELQQSREYLAAANAEMLRSQQAYGELAGKIQELESLRARVRDTDALSTAASAANEAAHRFEIESVRAQERLALQNARVTELNVRIQELSLSLEILRKERGNLELDVAARDERIREMQRITESLEGSIRETVTPLDSAAMQQERAQREAQVAELTRAMERLEGELAQANALVASHRDEREALQMQLGERSLAIWERDARLAVLQQEIDASHGIAEEHQKMAATLAHEVEELRSLSARQDFEGIAFKATIAELTQSLNQTKADVRQRELLHETQIAALEQEIEASRGIAEEHQTMAATLAHEVQTASDLLHQESMRANALAHDVDQRTHLIGLRDERIASLEQALAMSREATVDLHRTIDDLYAEWNALDTRLAERDREIQALQSEVQDATTSLGSERARTLEADEALRALQHGITQERATHQVEVSTLRSEIAANEARQHTLEANAAELESMLLEHTSTLTSKARAESIQLATLIDLIQSGKFWSFKRAFARVKRAFGPKVR